VFPVECYEQLLRNAAFGSVRLGANASSVRGTTGAEDDEGTLGRSLRILSFGSKHLQVTLKKNQVVHFGLYFRYLSDPVNVCGLRLSTGTSKGELRAWMRSAGIAAIEEIQPNGVVLQFDNGVVALFDTGLLDSLQVS